MTLSFRTSSYVAAAWLLILAGYVAVCLALPEGGARISAANTLLCVVPLVVNAGLLINAVSLDWRKKAFWMLLAAGCSLWLAGQALRTYDEVYWHRLVLSAFGGDVLFFLHTVPMIAALTMQPHKRSDSRGPLYAYADFGLMLCWWLYLYTFVCIPWQYVSMDPKRYAAGHMVVSASQNLVFAAGAAALAWKTTGYWRRIYANLAGAGALYMGGVILLNELMIHGQYSRIGLSNLPVLISLLWLGTIGLRAYQTRDQDAATAVPGPASPGMQEISLSNEPRWPAYTARAALLSLPLIGFWCLKASRAPMAVHEFRILLTLGAVLPLGALAFLRHELVDRERLRLLRASQDSIDNLKRLQTQFVQSEKLASIGQLVGGAAHEINNPLTAILGYSELLADDPTIGEKTRNLAEKIREQARRTRTLVNNLLSFARQVPSEQRTPLDINAIVNTAAQFRRFDLRGKNIRIEVQAGTGVPEVRCDMNQMLQVFSNIINNAVYAMQEAGGGTLTVRTMFERGNVVILFSDTGPGMRDPNLVFDPFYTTKPVGKGTGLGLSICYGLIRDQGGQISCYNRPEGGATFRIELPAAPAAFPFSPRAATAQTRTIPAKRA